jgi:hypothetical protein
MAEAGKMDELQELFPTLEEAFRAACEALQAMLEEVAE